MSDSLPESDDPIRVALLVTSVLEKLEIPYYVGGSVASTIYGKIRTTHDIDIIADINPEQIEDIVEALHEEFTSTST